MNDDPYRALGVAPNAEQAVIKAAYLALMKRHHPDRAGSETDRAREIAAAYRLIGSPERRAAFDRDVFERQAFFRASIAQQAVEPSRQTGRSTFFVLSAVTAGLLYVALNRPAPVFPPSSEPVAEAKREVIAPFELPGVKKEVAKMEPLPGIVVPELEVEPVRVVADPVPLPLPERREVREERAAAPAPLPIVERRPEPIVERRPVPIVRTEAKAPRPPATQAAAAPAQPAVDLKALERHQVILYNQSFLASDEAKRERLMASRLAFLKRLNACGSDLCRRDIYLARNQEVAAIMAR